MHYCDQTTREKCLWNWRKSLSWCSSELMQMADCHANFLTTVFGSTVASHPNRVGSHRVLKRTTFLAHSRSLVWQFPVEEWDAKWRNYSDFKPLAITDDGFLMSSLSRRSLRGFQNGRQNQRLFQRDDRIYWLVAWPPFLFKVQTDGKLLFWSIIFVFSLLSEFRSAMVEVLLSHWIQ